MCGVQKISFVSFRQAEKYHSRLEVELYTVRESVVIVIVVVFASFSLLRPLLCPSPVGA